MSKTHTDIPAVSDGSNGWDIRLSHDETSVTIERDGKTIRLSIPEAQDLAETMLIRIRDKNENGWSGYWTDALR